MAEQRRRAAVVGASLGGLSAAQVLQDSGFAVTVYEKHGAPFSDRGGGLYGRALVNWTASCSSDARRSHPFVRRI